MTVDDREVASLERGVIISLTAVNHSLELTHQILSRVLGAWSAYIEHSLMNIRKAARAELL
jgi:hypothetical protein